MVEHEPLDGEYYDSVLPFKILVQIPTTQALTMTFKNGRLRSPIADWLEEHIGLAFTPGRTNLEEANCYRWASYPSPKTGRTPFIYRFKNPQDAILFKLTWGGHDLA